MDSILHIYYALLAYPGQYSVFVHVWVGLSSKRECFPQEDTKAPYVTINVSLQIQYLRTYYKPALGHMRLHKLYMWYAIHYAVMVTLCDAWPYGLYGQYSLYSKKYCDIL